MPSAVEPENVPPAMFTAIGLPVECWATATAAPALVVPLWAPSPEVTLYALPYVAVSVAESATFSVPARTSTAELPPFTSAVPLIVVVPSPSWPIAVVELSILPPVIVALVPVVIAPLLMMPQ